MPERPAPALRRGQGCGRRSSWSTPDREFGSGPGAIFVVGALVGNIVSRFGIRNRRWQETTDMKHLVALLILAAPLNAADPVETPAEAKQRHERVAERRKGTDIICHRGASEFAHENTLEAFRATFELGGDGNEIDIRATKDGVLVCFHDDMLYPSAESRSCTMW